MLERHPYQQFPSFSNFLPSSPMRFHLILTAVCIATLAAPASADAKNRADDLYDSMKTVIKTIRIPGEAMESTELTYRSLPLSEIRALSFPVSWATRSILQKTYEPYRLSTAMDNAMAKIMLFKPVKQRDGSTSYSMPLDQFFSRVYLPVAIQTAETPELRRLVLQKPVASDLSSPEEGRGFIQFCSFRPVKKINPKTEISTVNSLDDLKNLLISNITVQSGQRSSNDVFVPNVYTYAISDTQFLGKPAVRLTMTFSTQLYNLTSDRAGYEGVYTLKDGIVICAEVTAYEAQFAAYHNVFDAIVASLVPKDAAATRTSSSSSGSTLTKATSSRAQERLCKRTKKCP